MIAGSTMYVSAVQHRLLCAVMRHSFACFARSRYNGSCRTVHNDIIDPSGRCVTCELVRVGLYSLGVYVALRIHFATMFCRRLIDVTVISVNMFHLTVGLACEWCFIIIS